MQIGFIRDTFIKQIDKEKTPQENFKNIYRTMLKVNIRLRNLPSKETLLSQKNSSKTEEDFINNLEAIANLNADICHHNRVETEMLLYKNDMLNKCYNLLNIKTDENEECAPYSEDFTGNEIANIGYLISKLIEYGCLSEILRFINEKGHEVPEEDYEELSYLHATYTKLNAALKFIKRLIIKKYDNIYYKLDKIISNPTETLKETVLYNSLFDKDYKPSVKTTKKKSSASSTSKSTKSTSIATKKKTTSTKKSTKKPKTDEESGWYDEYADCI